MSFPNHARRNVNEVILRMNSLVSKNTLVVRDCLPSRHLADPPGDGMPSIDASPSHGKSSTEGNTEVHMQVLEKSRPIEFREEGITRKDAVR